MTYPVETHNRKIFTTGAFLQPMKVKDVSGTDFWIWVVDRFEDTSYYDGNEYNPMPVADSLEELLIDRSDDCDD